MYSDNRDNTVWEEYIKVSDVSSKTNEIPASNVKDNKQCCEYMVNIGWVNAEVDFIYIAKIANKEKINKLTKT